MKRKRGLMTEIIESPSPARDVHGAARKMGISPLTVRKLVREKLLTHYRVGRRIIILDPDIDAFMAKCRIPARESRLISRA